MNILDSVGNTPMFYLTKFNSKLQCNLFAKCEMFNPILSIIPASSRGTLSSGGSSGVALAVAEKIARKTTNLATKPTIVVILPDSGFKYLSKFYKRESVD